MPAYARDGKVVCFFQDAGKFKARYPTLGFQDTGQPQRWFHVADVVRADQADPAVEEPVVALVKKAVS